MIRWVLRWRVPLAGALLVAILAGAGVLVFGPGGAGTPPDAQEIALAPPATRVVAGGALAAPPTTPLPTPSPPLPALPPLKVYIVGAVARPGVYSLNEGDRIEDAIRAAGGALADADLEGINLSARVHDEEQIRVPHRGAAPFTPAPAPPIAGTPVPPAPGSGGGPPSAKIDLNQADATALATLPGIGPALAGRIIAYRTEHGPFQHIEDIKLVRGIGDAIFESIRPYIVVGP
jgi:competence protein ComEA